MLARRLTKGCLQLLLLLLDLEALQQAIWNSHHRGHQQPGMNHIGSQLSSTPSEKLRCCLVVEIHGGKYRK